MILLTVIVLVIILLVGYQCYRSIQIVYAFFSRKKLYKFEHIPSYGDIPVRYKWCRSDDEALQAYPGWADFISEVCPRQRRILPRN